MLLRVDARPNSMAVAWGCGCGSAYTQPLAIMLRNNAHSNSMFLAVGQQNTYPNSMAVVMELSPSMYFMFILVGLHLSKFYLFEDRYPWKFCTVAVGRLPVKLTTCSGPRPMQILSLLSSYPSKLPALDGDQHLSKGYPIPYLQHKLIANSMLLGGRLKAPHPDKPRSAKGTPPRQKALQNQEITMVTPRRLTGSET